MAKRFVSVSKIPAIFATAWESLRNHAQFLNHLVIMSKFQMPVDAAVRLEVTRCCNEKIAKKL